MEEKTQALSKSIKWSALGEIGAKFITPITTVLLARILDPESFGVIAICNMLITFVDIFVEAGFNKYLIQRSYIDNNEKNAYSNVAFWTQLTIAIVLYILIVSFNYTIASILGNREYGYVISIASLQLIFVSLSSTHTALLRRNFEFKKLFNVRLITALGPLCISVPLAIILNSYWALIIGTLFTSLITTILLFISSKWIPQLYYSFRILKDMWNYSFWSLCEGVAHWAIWWIDIFIIGHMFSTYYVGLYKNSTHIVMSLFGMISSAMSPVLLSSLSRIKSNLQSNYILYNIEQGFMFLLLPIGIAIYFNDSFITSILLGTKWLEAAPIIGIWSIMMSISLIIYSFPAEAFKARGIPKLLFIYQILYLAVLIPLCIFSANIGFWCFVYTRCMCIIFQICLFIFFVKKYLKWNMKLLCNLSFIPIILNAIIYVILYFAIDTTHFSYIISICTTLIVLSLYLLFCKFYLKNTFKRIIKVLTHSQYIHK